MCFFADCVCLSEAGSRVDGQVEIALARRQRLFRLLAVMDVEMEHAPANDSTIGIAYRDLAVMEDVLRSTRWGSAARIVRCAAKRLRVKVLAQSASVTAR